MSNAATSPHVLAKIKWSRRIGIVGFMFFLVKGLLWLGMLAAAWCLR